MRSFARGADALDAVAWPTVELVISDRTNFPMDGVEFVRRGAGALECVGGFRLRMGGRPNDLQPCGGVQSL